MSGCGGGLIEQKKADWDIRAGRKYGDAAVVELLQKYFYSKQQKVIKIHMVCMWQLLFVVLTYFCRPVTYMIDRTKEKFIRST